MEQRHPVLINEPKHNAEKQGIQDIVIGIVQKVGGWATRPTLAEGVPW